MLEISYDNYDADDVSDDPSDLGGGEGNPPISLKQNEFSLKQFAKRMAQANFNEFNKWKKVWVAGFLAKKHRSVIWGKEPSETGSRWTPPLGEGGNSFFGHIQQLAAIG